LNIDKDSNTNEIDNTKYDDISISKRPSNRNSMPIIAAILLLIAGIFSILNWVQIFSLNETTLESLYNISQLKQIDPTMTASKLLGFLSTCAIVGCVIAVFQILGGVLALKRKMWGISVACSIIGLFSMGILFTSSILSLISMIILFISKTEFQQNIN